MTTAYVKIVEGVARLRKEPGASEQTVADYIIARAALLNVAHERGYERAAEMAFKLADEFSIQRGNE